MDQDRSGLAALKADRGSAQHIEAQMTQCPGYGKEAKGAQRQATTIETAAKYGCHDSGIAGNNYDEVWPAS